MAFSAMQNAILWCFHNAGRHFVAIEFLKENFNLHVKYVAAHMGGMENPACAKHRTHETLIPHPGKAMTQAGAELSAA